LNKLEKFQEEQEYIFHEPHFLQLHVEMQFSILTIPEVV